MNLQEQTAALRTVYVYIRKRLYDPILRKKIIAAMRQKNNRKWYLSILKKLEYTTFMAENCLLMCEPKRALRYLTVLHILIKRLEERTYKDHQYLMKKMRLPLG